MFIQYVCIHTHPAIVTRKNTLIYIKRHLIRFKHDWHFAIGVNMHSLTEDLELEKKLRQNHNDRVAENELD